MAELPSTNNSLTQFLQQLLRVQKNSMEIVAKLNDFTISTAPTIIVDQELQDGTTKTFELPSVGYLKNQIARIDSNFEALTGLDGGDITVRMPDGSYKKIIESSLFKSPKRIGQLLVPSKFNRKNNWFFESFLNPLLYISFDITNYVEYNTRQISYKRIIVNCDNDDKKSYFDNTLKGRNDIEYDLFLNDLASRKITYFVDEDIVDLPISIPRYSGSFDVTSYTDETVPVTQPNGTIVQTKIRKYRLNTLKYSDNLLNFRDSLILKPGDKIDVGQASTYEIVTADSDTNTITVKITSGTETIPIGVGVLSISLLAFAIKEVQLNIGFDEREVIFIKAIDKDSNITTRDFSPGVGIYTNELVIDVPDGQVSLDTFYKQEVMDFGASLLTLVKEGTIPAIYGEIPDPPRLSDTNFKVVLVNTQKFDSDTIDTLKKKISQKNSTGSEITQIEASIDKKKQELNIGKFNSDTERRGVQNQLETLIREKTSKSNLYASIVKDLSTTAKNLPPELANPKYRVRGFFPIPQAKPSFKTLDQEVIAFVISYRYLRTDGTAPGTDQLDFTDNNGETVRGYFSNWEEYQTKVRQKSYDSSLGIYVWRDENVQDADHININQVDVPITPGERVEIRIKSLSEAGWPMNPLESEWSSSIVMSFPDDLSADEEILASLNAALSEETRVNFNQDLAARGLDIHLSTSFLQKDQYYAHPADSIFSGFYDDAGNAINLFNKIKDLETRLAELKAQVEKAKGKLQVYIVDPNGEKYLVANNSTVDLFAGYYSSIVAALPAPRQKGAIVSQKYSLIIENAAVSPLHLASSFPGGLDIGLPISSSGDPSLSVDYVNSRKYDQVPISLASVNAANTDNSKKYQSSPFQSSQQLSQYLYCRYTDIGLMDKIYGSLSGPNSNIENNSLYPIEVGPATSFIWNMAYYGTAPAGGGHDSSFAIHISHPDINDGNATPFSEFNQPSGASGTSPAVYPKFVHASYFNKQSFEAGGLLQTEFIPTNISGSTGERYPIKQGFYANDRYLIGTDTCGSYLYLAPPAYMDLLVDGTDYRSVREIEYGENNQIIIPIIYQFRMTDYFGDGQKGLGRVGGSSTGIKNLIYTKKLGIDINVKEESLFSFDLQITSKYKVDNPSQTSISPVKNTKLAPKQTNALKKIF